VAIPHLIEEAILSSLDLNFHSTFGFSITVLELLGLILILMAITVLSRFRLGVRTGGLLIAIYVAGSIAAVVVMAVFNTI
jgi:hypothetical protein